MLSFDITDRHIRIVRGSEARGKIKLSAASTIDLQEGLIVNGHIKDIPRLANIINDELKAHGMEDKEAVVTLSSNLVIFKELHIPKAKTSSQMLTMVTNQMQHTMGIAEEYSISYSIAGEVEEEGVQAQKILATACPFEVVDCFRKVFSMLNISLKSVCVSCNAISRLILSDKKIASRMPMLVVQVDPTFVSINLYENNQLSFARFASIDPLDYDNSEDYVYEAVNENIYRMVQFHKSRNPQNPIQNVIFYGDTSEYIRLTNALESMEIATSQLSVNTTSISGYENIEALTYANAIGAMFRSNKDVDRINLLETDSSAGRSDAGSGFLLSWGGAVVLSAAVILAINLGIGTAINNNDNKIAEIDEYINSPEVAATLAEVDLTQSKIDKVALFKNDLDVAIKNFDTKNPAQADLINELFETIEGQDCAVKELSFASGEITLTCLSTDNLAPDNAAQAIYELDKFDNIVYSGFKESDAGGLSELEGTDEVFYEFEIKFNLRPIEVEEEPAAETAEDNATEEGGAEE
ncbi:MAG: pilus assembly protein PilM [Oscillospiraceae bacterium]|nr:pilus assembly protein PilM [Oscillospiraceae bacterium]MDY3793038.1 pilus assembly protein PilM [Oscillospiraceae bacterium]MDY6208696.1 pilus assembly protein PilM [Oscillospiraceae bacterium]